MVVTLLAHIQLMNRRTDRSTALLIDAAIHIAALAGAVRAARELQQQGVPLEIAMRVLTRPDERRIYAWTRGDDNENKSQG